MASRRPVAVDLFCGAGGMSLGFEQAGFDVLAAVDHDPVHLAVHSYNFPLTAVVCSDIEFTTTETIHSAIRKGWASHARDGEWDGTIDCVFGGPSCQGFSYIGLNNTDDQRNDLIFAFSRLVADLQPKSFVLENVPGIMSPKYRGALAKLMNGFRRAGYKVAEDRPLLLDAADHGVPQWRKRVFLVGVLNDTPLPVAPAPALSGPTTRNALSGLPNVDGWQSLRTTERLTLTERGLAELRLKSSDYAQTLRSPFMAEYPRQWDERVITGAGRTDHSTKVTHRFQKLPHGGEDGPSRFRRLDPKGKSFTLRAGTGRDHGSFTAPRPIHYAYPRVVTVREAARLHSYPDWFGFHVTKWHAHRQIGNSVPPRLAYAVASSITKALGVNTAEPPTTTLALGDPTLLSMSLVTAADHFDYDRRLLPWDVRRKDLTKSDVH
ncbi:MAG: DNA cytosine methyltransferase [Acidimicrobiales bacterium]